MWNIKSWRKCLFWKEHFTLNKKILKTSTQPVSMFFIPQNMSGANSRRLNNWRSWGLLLKQEKTNTHKKRAPNRSSSLWKPLDSKCSKCFMDWKTCPNFSSAWRWKISEFSFMLEAILFNFKLVWIKTWAILQQAIAQWCAISSTIVSIKSHDSGLLAICFHLQCADCKFLKAVLWLSITNPDLIILDMWT